MSGAFSIFKREASAYFATPMGWIILLFFTFIFGFFFALSVTAYLDYASQTAFNPMAADSLDVNTIVVQGVFGNMAVVILLIAPGLVMRLLAEDRKQKSIELLLTSPISSLEIVLGKFMGAMGFVAVMLLCTIPFVSLLYSYGSPDFGILACNYLSLFLLTSALVSVNLFFSSFTENQIIAFIAGFGFNLMFWILGWAADMAGEGMLQTVVQGAALGQHFMDLGKGLIKIQDLIYFFTFIAFNILATTQRVESLRWR
jgi:ABC-2 type transport system permease protein